MKWRAIAGLILTMTAAPPAIAADYPSRPIKLVVPYAAGGPTDVLGRLVGEYLGRDLKQPVIVAYAKQNSGKLTFGSAGTGGTIHLAGEMFKQMAGVDLVHVPYKGEC